jgi:hypothetical protein
MLVFNPQSRINAEQCLEHEYLGLYHNSSRDSMAPGTFDNSLDEVDLPTHTWKVQIPPITFNQWVMVYSEILDFHRIQAAEAGASTVYIRF